MRIEDLENRINQLVVQAKQTLMNARVTRSSSVPVLVREDFTRLRAASLAFIESTFGRGHSYYTEFDTKVTADWESDGKSALGILTAIQDQITGGWLDTTKGLVTAEVFADFIEMAEHLLDQNYKDAAAVMVGSVLEEHLRQLCASIPLPVEDPSSGKALRADSLNGGLSKAGKYDKLDQKQVTAWLDLRNKAAHGKYSDYTNEQVRLMLDGVRNFISRVRP